MFKFLTNPMFSPDSGMGGAVQVQSTPDVDVPENSIENVSTNDGEGNSITQLTGDESTQQILELLDSGEYVVNALGELEYVGPQGELQEEQSQVDEDGNPVEEAEPQTEPKFKVTVDGQEVELTEQELKDGYMRQSNYTQKTQELAVQRKIAQEFKEATGFDLLGLAREYIKNPESLFQDVPALRQQVQPQINMDQFTNPVYLKNLNSAAEKYVLERHGFSNKDYVNDEAMFNTEVEVVRQQMHQEVVRDQMVKLQEQQKQSLIEQQEYMRMINFKTVEDNWKDRLGQDFYPFHDYVVTFVNRLPKGEADKVLSEIQASPDDFSDMLSAVYQIYTENKGKYPMDNRPNIVVPAKVEVSPPKLETTSNEPFSNNKPKKQIDLSQLVGMSDDARLELLMGNNYI